MYSSDFPLQTRNETCRPKPRVGMYNFVVINGPIIVVGGFTSWPRDYRRFSGILRELSGSEVHVVPLTPLDWVAGHFRGFGQLVFDIATTVDRALLESDSDKVVLVGHSAGGVACRVYIGGDPPYGGRRYSGHRRVSHLITLGSPHVAADKRLAAVNRVNTLFPGAQHADAGLEYLSVAGSAEDGSSPRKTSRKARKKIRAVRGRRSRTRRRRRSGKSGAPSRGWAHGPGRCPPQQAPGPLVRRRPRDGRTVVAGGLANGE